MESIKERKSCSEEGGSELEITVSGSSTMTSGKQPDDNNNIVKKNIHLDLSSSDSQEELNDVDEKYSTNLVHNFQVVSFLRYTFQCNVVKFKKMWKIYLIPGSSHFT